MILYSPKVISPPSAIMQQPGWTIQLSPNLTGPLISVFYATKRVNLGFVFSSYFVDLLLRGAPETPLEADDIESFCVS